jgi:hypothetical protein
MAALVGLGGVMTAAQAATDFCPTAQLAPLGIAVDNATHCKNPNQSPNGCLLTFSNFQWWTAFNFAGPYFNNAYYYNDGLKTIFAPEHVFVDGQGLHLVVDHDINIGIPNQAIPWTGAEAVAMFDTGGNEVNFGYGDYLVAIKSAPALGAIDPNVAVGMFTYERYGSFNSVPFPTWGGSDNPNREMDLAEISRWGWNQTTGSCPNSGLNGLFNTSILCKGSAQFATQLVPKSAISVQRYDIGLNINEITLVLQWREGEVKFLKFDGAFTLSNLPQSPARHTLTWTTPTPLLATQYFQVATPAALRPFISTVVSPSNSSYTPRPTKSCARFHLNFWLGYFQGPRQGGGCPGCNPGPSTRQEVIITHFQYRPI